MVQSWFRKNREGLFPEIKDFTDSMDEYRYETNVKKMDHWHWYWFHPTAFKIIFYGRYPLTLAIFCLLGIWAVIVKSYFSLGVITIFSVFIALDMYRNWNRYHPDTTFYDIWIRDYPIDDMIEQELNEENNNGRT